jgi:hypothetical protein
MSTALYGHVLQRMPTPSRGHGTQPVNSGSPPSARLDAAKDSQPLLVQARSPSEGPFVIKTKKSQNKY